MKMPTQDLLLVRRHDSTACALSPDGHSRRGKSGREFLEGEVKQEAVVALETVSVFYILNFVLFPRFLFFS